MKRTPPENIILTDAALIKYTMFSLIFAGIALVTLILPAEYNIDPTGIGNSIGLTVFNSTKAEAVTPDSSQDAQGVTETIELTIPAGRGIEYKFIMQQYQKLAYEWVTDGDELYFDLHGEPEGDTSGYFESYAIATLDEMTGSFTAPFTGSHGWYWKNTTDEPVMVELTVSGEYVSHSLK